MNTLGINRKFLWLLFVTISVIGAIVWAQTSDQILNVDKTVDHDLYAANYEINVGAKVDGDLIAAGQRIVVAGDVSGDIIVAGRLIEIDGPVGDDIRAAGQHVTVTGPVSGHMVAAGQSITVTNNIGDWASLAGNRVEVTGTVMGNLKIRANHISINGEVGNAELIGDKLNLGPEAVVSGEMTWRSKNEADINPAATIQGMFVAAPPPDFFEEVDGGGGTFFTISVIIAVMGLFLIFSKPLHANAKRIAERPIMAFVLGFVVFSATPVLAILLLVSRFGVWLGLGVLGAYAVILLVGVLTGLFAVSHLALRRLLPNPAIWQALAAILVTVVAVSLVSQLPFVGVIVVLSIWWLGLGALCWNGWIAIQGSRSDTQPVVAEPVTE